MDKGIDLFTKIFIDTNLEKATIIDTIARFIVGTVKGTSIITEQAEFYLFKNSDYIEGISNQTSDDFLYFKYYLEIEPAESAEDCSYILQISCLLTELWDAGFQVVASCDFEEFLPRKGGYNFENR
ncbi:1,4-dihydroxy-6-naphthoate synthase [Lysinibacillus agricola]|uniref:1,4-dihydroxy-6-naphthoate synthase n=1 Tax=Lysinibacillus agricola TaxID=2590012 RepID=UPI003C1F6990